MKGDQHHFFVMSGQPPCPDCKGPCGVKLSVGATGFSCGSGYEHKPDCPQLRCKHGVLWEASCEECDAQSRLESEESEEREENDYGDFPL